MLAALAVAGIVWAVLARQGEIAAVGHSVLGALWLLPLLIGIHLVQLLLSSAAWRVPFPAPRPGLGRFFRLRLIREGIDSLFPVAQVGGEVFAARMLAGSDVAAGTAGASVIVDVTLEVLAQAGFLVMGLAVLTALTGADRSADWAGPIVIAILGAGGCLAAQRLGVLRLLEWLVDRIGRQFPLLAGMSLDGLHAAVEGFYRRKAPLGSAGLLHLLSWSLGTLETWAALAALGAPASLPQALVVESLGMAARSAGFAIPGALAVQEGGFALAALSVGLPDSAGVALSLLKRVREILVGVAGVSLARWDSR
jgi:putative membrane protein